MFNRIFLATTLLVLAMSAWGSTLQFSNDGILIDAEQMGKFTLGYPLLIDKTDAVVHKPIETSLAPGTATVKYDGGGEVKLSIKGNDVTLLFANIPTDVTKYRMEMLIGFEYNEGGSWQIADGPVTLFPKTKPEKPHLYQGNATSLTLADAQGRQLSFTIPPFSYQQLQDNREWNWKTYAWLMLANYRPDIKTQTLTIASGLPAGGVKRVILVDRYGQDMALDFPGKVKNDTELPADIALDDAYYGGLQPPASDSYGGLPDSGNLLGLQKTGYFHVEKKDKNWLLVDPLGNATFHLGICAFAPSDDYTYIKGREDIFEWLPPYDGEYQSAFHPDKYWSHDAFSFYLANVIRKFGKPYEKEEWSARIIPRVRKFGFNASGAFSSPTKAHQQANFPYVLTLPLGEWTLGKNITGLRGIFDPYDVKTAEKITALFSREVAAQANNPLIIGYFLDNEQAFEDIPRVIPTLKANQPAKVKLVQMLKNKYPTIEEFNTAWGMKVTGFDELLDMGLPVTTKEAASDMQNFTGQFLEAYYKLIADTFHKYDANHLLIGNRWQPGTANNEQLCRIAGKYLDVISVNYYTYAVDKEFLTRIYHWTADKPMMLSEFYWASPSDTGLPGGNEVASQQERGLAYRNYVEQAAATGFVVGIEWFTLIDQARSGRWFEKLSGEKANSGIFNVADRPYKIFLAECMKTNYDIFNVIFGKRQPFSYDNPKFQQSSGKLVDKIPHAPGVIKLDGQRDDWPGTPAELISGKRLVQGSDAGGLGAAFRLCWDEKNLYLMVAVIDTTPMKNDLTGNMIWSADAVELFIGAEGLEVAGPLLFSDRQLLLSAGDVNGTYQHYFANSPKQYPCELVVIRNVDGTGYTMEAAIPFNSLAITPAEGQQLRFDLAIDDSADGKLRLRQIVWNGIRRNSTDRTYWGRALLVK